MSYTHYDPFFYPSKYSLWIILLCLYHGLALATEIKHVHVNLQHSQYVLSTEVDYQLTEKAKEALEHGVPLFWTLRINVSQQRDWLWAKTLVSTSVHYHLQYHALLNMYRVTIVHPDSMRGNSYNFSTLSAALDLMASLRNLPLIDYAQVDDKKNYLIEIKADFNRDELPLPLQPIAYLNPQWYLSSNWTLWHLKK